LSKLWVFGDSYGVSLSHSIDWFWADIVKNKLKCDEHINSCVLGAANDYTQYCIMKQEVNIKSDDYVIIISTGIERKWFFFDKPHTGNFFCSNLKELVGKDAEFAIRQYITHLINPKAIYINFYQFLGWVHYTTTKNNWNVLVIPGFEEKDYPISHKYKVKGSLFDVCNNEFCTDSDNLWFYRDYCKGRDCRSGHLIKDNHEILANKITNTFLNSETLDLTTGFKNKIISKNSIELLKDQFIVI